MRKSLSRFTSWLTVGIMAMAAGHLHRKGFMLAAVGDDPTAIEQELKRIGDQVKDFGEKALREAAAAAGKLSQETKEKVDSLLIKQGELQAELKEVQQKLDRRGSGGDDLEEKSMGQQFIGAEQYKSFIDEGGIQHKNSGYRWGVKAITSAPTSAGAGVAPDRLPGVIGLPQQQLRVRDLISPGTTESNLIQYVRETGFTNNAGIQAAEGDKKGESTIVFDQVNSSVQTIAHFTKASKQILSDFSQLASIIDQRLYYGLKFVEDRQLLNGSGVGANLNGIYTQATAYAAPAALANATRIDVLRLALLQSELAEYPATGIVLNPIDWALIELTKDSQGRYIIGVPQGITPANLWRRPIVTTKAIEQNEFLAGAFQLGAQVFDREEAAISIATENADDFERNLVTIRAEERLALAVYRPEAFVKGDLVTTP